MEIALYIVLGALVAVAIGVQVWVIRAGTVTGTGRGALLLRLFNLVLIIGVVILVIYVLSGK